MKFQVSPTVVFRTLRVIGRMAAIWPLTKEDNKYWVIRVENFMWWFYLANHVLLFFPTLRSFINHRKVLALASRSLTELIVIIESILVMLFFRYKKSSLQVLLVTAEAQLRIKKKEIVKKYITLYAFVFILLLLFFGASIVICLFLPKVENTLIFSATYPYGLKSKLLKTLLFLHQWTCGSHIFLMLIHDAILLFLIFTCTDRLKTIDDCAKCIENYSQLSSWIHHHSNILTSIKETNDVARFMMLKNVISFLVYSFNSGFEALNYTSYYQLINQFFIIATIYLRILLNCDSAGEMTSASSDIALTIYSTRWYNEQLKSITMKKIIIMRCQKLTVIGINGFMPSLNRGYLLTVLSATYTYFMTLRTVLGSR